MSVKPPIRAGALSVLAAGFVLSAALRMGDVMAGLPDAPDDGFGNRFASPVERGGSADPSVTPGQLADELRRQAERLVERERAVDLREKELAGAELRLRTQLAELESARSALERELGQAASAADDDVRHLAEMYRSMKPKQAGRIFDAMEPSFAAGFLGELGPDAAAQILSSMTPDRAYAVSLVLAGRSLSDDDGRVGEVAGPLETGAQ